MKSLVSVIIIRKGGKMGGISLKIIDVSEFQGHIEWEKVKNSIDGVILRCGYGGDYKAQDDSTFKYNADMCTKLNIPFGVYLYSYADSKEKAESESKHILRLIKPYKLSFPVYLDCEENKTSVQKFSKTACQIIGTIIENEGLWFGVYANLNWWNTHLKTLDSYTKWVAQYNNICDYKKPYDMWQYTSKGSINGIKGNVDLNKCYVNFPNYINNKTEYTIEELKNILGVKNLKISF